MDSKYDHKLFEDKIYKQWEEKQAFEPRKGESGETFTVIMPPPNANNPLHIGHAMFSTLEDILIRYQRMLGKDTLWLPGTDHAGIETQFMFEKKLAKEGKSRFDFDRQTLYQMVWDYVQENSDVAVNQLKKMGASADWSRFKFMLDPDIVKTVISTFEKMHSEGLIYRELRLVNYCTKCGTGYSDLEVDHVEQVDPLYYVKYQIENSQECVVVATVRPETIFGDVAIAIHPKHKSAKKLVGLEVINPLTKQLMPIIADEAVDPEFGTGMLKITPKHDNADFEIWQRHDQLHNTQPLQVVDFNGKLKNTNSDFDGKSVFTARKEVVALLETQGSIDKVNAKYSHNVGVCYRCGRVIEPLPSPQFYVKVKPLTEKVIEKLDQGEVQVLGAGHDKILKNWLENLRDWNISRQIVWGIRIPVWYEIGSKKQNEDNKNDEIEVVFLDEQGNTQRGKIAELMTRFELEIIKKGLQSLQAPIESVYVVSPTSPGENFIQETDTFDTWFSSAQWPFSTLKATKTGDFEKYYPTQVMETGYDILPFWVMRMLMVGLYSTGKLPFDKVYLHGLVRDAKGQKMSKSKGNVVNPLEIVEKYGADALRMALVIRSSAGIDKSVGEADFKAMRNFTNKIWNAARFVEMGVENFGENGELDGEIDKRFEEIRSEVGRHLDEYRIGLAADVVYGEFWHWYCDSVIERAKENKVSTKVLIKTLVGFLKLLHPFVPFVSEAVYGQLRQSSLKKLLVTEESMLITSKW